jgi:hypothetical protein
VFWRRSVLLTKNLKRCYKREVMEELSVKDLAKTQMRGSEKRKMSAV